MFKLVLEKAEEPELKLPTSTGSSKKQESSRKTSISALLTMPKPLNVWITVNCGKFWKRWEYQTIWPASWETCIQVSKQQNWTWNNRLVPNRKRSTSRMYIVTLLIYLICRVHHEKRWAGRSTSWNQDCQEKYQSPQICRWHHPYGWKWRVTKKPLDESERGECKSWLKAQHSEN